MRKAMTRISDLRCHRRPVAGGFTLIEVMIVVAIIGILAAIALPAYIEQIKRGKRADAQTVMMQAQQYLQRYYAANSTYAAADLTGKSFATAPAGAASGSQNYNVSLPAASLTASSYTLQADPTFSDPACGSLTLADTGAKGVTGTSTPADCWK